MVRTSYFRSYSVHAQSGASPSVRGLAGAGCSPIGVLARRERSATAVPTLRDCCFTYSCCITWISTQNTHRKLRYAPQIERGTCSKRFLLPAICNALRDALERLLLDSACRSVRRSSTLRRVDVFSRAVFPHHERASKVLGKRTCGLQRLCKQ